MDLKNSQPFRFRCDVPLEILPHVIPMVPVTIALMFMGDKVISPGLCFTVEGCYFHIKIEEEENGRYEVILRDISGLESAPQGSWEIDPEVLEELRRRFESEQDWENN